MAAVEGGTKLAHTHPRSKFLKAITDKQQEISGWAREGRPHTEYARQLGQLTENVTLDMMLQEHLFELSRSRYKFKVNTRYEKKMFLQRQMMKSSVLKEKLKNVQFEDRRPKWAQGRPITQHEKRAREKVATLPPPSTTPSRMMRKNAPAPPTKPKPDSAPLRRNPNQVTEIPRAQTRTTFYESGTVTKRLSSAKGGEKFFVTEPDLLPTKRRKTPTINELSPTPTHGMIITPGVSTAAPKGIPPRKDGILRKTTEFYIPPQTAPERLVKDVNLEPPKETKARRESRIASQKAKLQSWAQANRAVNEQRQTRDERYLGLERSLTDNYFGRNDAPNVDDIIERISTLHVQPRRTADKRPRVTKQMRALFAANNQSLPVN